MQSPPSLRTAHAAGDPFDLDRIGRLSVRVYTERDGLLSQLVTSLAVDLRGRLWAGSDSGLAHFNGRSWIEVPLPAKARTRDVRSLRIGSDGSLWVGTLQGLLRFADGRWVGSGSVTKSYDDEALVSLSGLEVQDIHEVVEDGRSEFWAATRNSVYRLAGREWTKFDSASGLPSTVVWRLLPTWDESGRLTLFAATSDGIARYTPSESQRWSVFASAGPQGLPRPEVWSLLETVGDDGGRVLLAGTPVGLARYENSCWSVVDTSDGLPHNYVWTMAETLEPDGSRTLWVGTWGGGLGRFAHGRWQTLKGGSPDPIDGQVWCLLDMGSINGTRGLWAGTGSGIVRIGAGAWRTIDVSSVRPDACVSSFLELTGESGESALWMGTTSDGVIRLEGGRLSVFDEDSGLPHNAVGALFATDSPNGGRTPWVATLGGVARFDGEKFVALDETTGTRTKIACAFERTLGRRESAWVAMNVGLGKLEGERLTLYPLPAEVPSRYVAVTETEKADGERVLWLGTRSHGLVRLRDAPHGDVDVITTSSPGYPGNETLCLRQFVEADGRKFLLVGTTNGLAWRDVDDDDGPWAALTAPRVPGGTAYRIERDARGRYYVMTNRGIVRYEYRGSLPSDPSGFTAHTYTTDDGLPSMEGNFGASMVDSLGRIWFGTAGGPAIFDPALEVEDRTAKPLTMERVTIDGKARDLERRGSLSWRENNLEFEFALLSYFREADSRYRSQLVGFDREPTEWTQDYRRIYTNLPARNYVFRVWGQDYAGNVSGPIEIAFRIRSAPWKTWWAYLLYTGAAAGAAYAGVRYRIDSLERRGHELEALVERRTAELSESEQRALEANQSKSVFLANMSHELRTPLNAVLGFAQLMERDRSLADEHREHLEIIRQSGEHLLGLINDVLSISKIEAGRLTLVDQSFSLHQLLGTVERIIRLRAEAKGLDLVFALDSDLPRYVRGDEGKLRQVLINLLGNAVKFTERGRVSLRARGGVNGQVRFEVEDTGYGIAAEEMAQLYEPFAQTESGRVSRDGTGLGLAISREIVRLMRGDILVQSTLGRGTVFCVEVELPAVGTVEVRSHKPRVIGIASPKEAIRILIADDVRENRVLLVRLLSEVGFEVREARNGHDALTIWENWRPHFVLMDMRMPEMDGREATRTIREAELRGSSSAVSPATPARQPSAVPNGGQRTRRGRGRHSGPCTIIAITASALHHEVDEILACGADDFLAKPFHEQMLFEKLSRHLAIRYVYETASTAGAPAASADDGVLTARRLSALPAAFVEALRDAINTGDVDAAARLVEECGDEDEPLIEALRSRIRDYRIDELFELFRRIE